MKKLTPIAAMAAFLALGFVAGEQVIAQGVNLVVNGDFEEPDIPAGSFIYTDTIPGWAQFKGFTGIEVQDHAVGSPFSGNQLVELDSLTATGIFQDVPTQAGCVYELSFAFSPRPARSAAENILRVTWDGQEVITVSADGSGLLDTDWTVHTFSVAGGSGSTTTRLELEDLGPSNRVGTYIDAVSVVEISCEIEVQIDIKPGSFPNSINPASRGKIPVAILTTDTFDATTVDGATVLFGATGTEAAPVQFSLRDVDGDGDTDMILHFNTQDTGIQCGDTVASLTGETFSGQMFQASDSVNTVGCE